MSTNDDKVYVGQEAWELRLDTEIDISGASALKIKYKKPSGTIASFTATAYDGTTVRYAFKADSDELDESGNWTFWAWVTMADGRDIPGKPITIYIKAEGSV